MKSKQDVLLEVAQVPDDLDLLYNLWTIANAAPSKCAEILASYRDVGRACRLAVLELEAVREVAANLQKDRKELDALLDWALRFKKELGSFDEEQMMNRTNRLCTMAEKIRVLRMGGELELLRTLLEPKGAPQK